MSLSRLFAHVSVVESMGELRARFYFVLSKIANKAIRKAQPVLENSVKEKVRLELLKSPEIGSLLGQDNSFVSLKAQFGLIDSIAIGAVSKIIEKIVSSIIVRAAPIKRDPNIMGQLIINILPFDLHELLTIEEATYISINRAKNTQIPIPWLEWLLFRGADVIITGYRIESPFYGGKSSPYSRTDGTHMVESGEKDNEAGVQFYYRVEPSSFCGTEDDNFITRAVVKVIPDIVGEMKAVMLAAL